MDEKKAHPTDSASAKCADTNLTCVITKLTKKDEKTAIAIGNELGMRHCVRGHLEGDILHTEGFYVEEKDASRFLDAWKKTRMMKRVLSYVDWEEGRAAKKLAKTMGINYDLENSFNRYSHFYVQESEASRFLEAWQKQRKKHQGYGPLPEERDTIAIVADKGDEKEAVTKELTVTEQWKRELPQLSDRALKVLEDQEITVEIIRGAQGCLVLDSILSNLYLSVGAKVLLQRYWREKALEANRKKSKTTSRAKKEKN